MGAMKKHLAAAIEMLAWNLADIRGTFSRQSVYETRLWSLWERRPEKLRRLAIRYRVFILR